MNTSSRIKKVYHLRKTVSTLRNKEKVDEQKTEKQEVSHFKLEDQDNNPQIMQNNSIFKKNNKELHIEENYTLQDETTRQLVEGPELSVNTLFLSFQEKLDCIQTQQIKLKNIGSSAIYYQWKFKNQAKVNINSIKDVKPKFFCHYSKQSIKPAEQITFIFSFVSQVPGIFTEECELICQPKLATQIPVIRLQGKAYIDDEWKDQRANFLKQLEQSVRQCSVSQTVDDLIDQVKLPEPEKPNVKDLKVAEEIFQKVNENLKLFFNPYLHNWFNELFQKVWSKQYQGENRENEMYWDQSIQSFRIFIQNCSNIDEVQKICFTQRLQHYTYLSTFPLPNKSQLYQTVYSFISQAAYKLGGDYSDAVKKQLDMWEVPFRQPLQTDSQEDLKARKQQVEKIKAQWLKRTKKKKWGEQQQKQMLQEFKNKLRVKTTNQILSQFQGFQSEAQYTKIQKTLLNDSFNPQNYFLFLERMKTVNQFPLEGKKVLLKFNLKLKDNCEKELQQLSEYLIKKEEQKKKIEEEKKNLDAKKKKPVPKKKGQKQEEEQKVLTFDFSSLLDQQNWNGFVESFRIIQEKAPFLILIGCTYRDRLGRADQNLTVAFLLQQLRTIEPSIQFMAHKELMNIKENIQNETISEGGIFLLENLNFLPSQTLVCEQIEPYQEDGVEKYKKSKRNVLYPEIRANLDIWASSLDLIVDCDRFLPKASGISSYAHLQVILDKTWWNYVALVKRSYNQSIILSGDFTPESYLLISRLLKYAKKIYLTGSIGAKFRIAQGDKRQMGNLKINDKQLDLIRAIISNDGTKKLFIPQILKFLSQSQQDTQQKQIVVNLGNDQQVNQEDLKDFDFIDIADDIGNEITKNSCIGHLFMIGKSHNAEYDQKLHGTNSTINILKNIYKIQEQKRTRHSIEVNTPSGIDFSKDMVFYLVRIDQSYVQSIQLKEKKVKISEVQQGQQQQQVEQNQEPQQEGEGEKKKIDLVADFKLSSQRLVTNLLSGKFDHGLKNISRYPKPRVI